MIHHLERVMLRRSTASPGTLNKGSSRDPKYADRRFLSGMEKLLDLQRTHGNAFVQRLVQQKLAVGLAGDDRYGQQVDRVANPVVRKADARVSIFVISRYVEPSVRRQCTEPITGMIARQPNPPPPADRGWSDAPKKDLNEWVITVDDKGNIVTGKGTSKGVWRVPIEGLGIGYLPKKDEQGPAFESAKGKAVALIPNTVTAAAAEKEKTVPVDVLLHLHGHGVGYRELQPGKQDAPGVLQAGQLRDVELYQMEQQLPSHVAASKRLLIAVLPQGSEKSAFGDLSSNSDAYLKEVFAKLVPKYLPQGAIPGRVIVSGHSGGGPTAMAIAVKAGKRTDVLLFDAINSACVKEEQKADGKTVTDKQGNPVMVCKSPKVCKSFEYGTVSTWVKGKLNADKKTWTGNHKPSSLRN